jgi:hypothetical protein
MVVNPERDIHMIIIQEFDRIFSVVDGRKVKHILITVHREDNPLVPKKMKENLRHGFCVISPQLGQHLPLEDLMKSRIESENVPPDFDWESHLSITHTQ